MPPLGYQFTAGVTPHAAQRRRTLRQQVASAERRFAARATLAFYVALASAAVARLKVMVTLVPLPGVESTRSERSPDRRRSVGRV